MATCDSRCPACGAPSEPAFDAQDWFLHALPGTFSYRRCTACRATFLSPGLDEAQRMRAHGGYHSGGGRSLLERVGEPLAMREAIALRKAVDSSGSVVDIGCGDGLYMERLRKAGWSGPMRGVEPSVEAARNTAERLGIPVDVGTADQHGLKRGDVDVVVMRHVIEHLPDPRATLEGLHSVLPPGGTLYLGMPDGDALSASVFGRYWHGWDPPRHACVLTAAGLRRLLVETGFEAVTERWDFSPQMWTASLNYAVTKGKRRPRAARLLGLENPLVGLPAGIGALLEVLLRRSTMYSVRARRVDV